MSRVLIVDDNEKNLYLLEALLKGNGFEVNLASNGEEALAQTRKILPDLIISDILMPVMDGFSFCRECKKDNRLKLIPFIFYTATYTDPKDEQFALSLGADFFIVKPVEPDVFIQLIKNVLIEYQGGLLTAGKTTQTNETIYLKQYNETLIRKLEDKLLQLEEANKSLIIKDFAIASSINGIIITDLSGKITYANDSFIGIYGFDKNAIIGKSLNWIFNDEKFIDKIITTINQKSNWLGEIKGVKKDGTDFIMQVTANMVKDHFGKSICLMFFCLEITERIKLQEELQRVQRLEALSIFAGGIAHDFNNFLTGLYGNIQLIMLELPEDHPARKSLDTIMAVYERAKDLTQRLLSFSKSITAGKQPVNLKDTIPEKQAIKVIDVINECCRLQLNGSTVNWKIKSDSDIWLVEGDANQLSQVFNNIIINASQSMSKGGLIEIFIYNRILEEFQIGKLHAGKYVEITFKDNGTGIPKEVLPNIFDPFYTTKEHGTGLGLATSFSIINSHNGHIGVTSKLNEGSEFSLFLPVSRKTDVTSCPITNINEKPISGRILIMDDDQIVRETAKQYLEKADYLVKTVADGEEAISIYRKSFSQGTPYDLVILDLIINSGKGGVETIKELFKIDPNIAVIVSSSYTNNPVLFNPYEYGFIATIPKPYLPHELISIVKAVIANRLAKK